MSGLCASVLAVSLAVTQSGIDVSRYWATAGAFAREVARTVPADAPIAYQNVQSTALIYYGRRIGRQIRLADWIATHGRRRLPWLVCKRACTYRGRKLAGDVLLQQKDAGQKRIQVLFKPKPPHTETRLSLPVSGLASPRPPATRARPTRP